MTFSQFKLEFDIVRDNRRAMRSIMRELQTLSDDRLSTVGSGAIDYSKERVQASHDPDNAIINTLARIDKDTDRLKEKLRRLEDANERYEELIYSADGIGGEVVRLYVIEGLAMRLVAQHLHYSPAHCWKLHGLTLKQLYEKSEQEATT